MAAMTGEKIAILGVWGEPATSYVIDALLRHGFRIDAVYFDSKQATSKDREIWNDRTAGALPGIPLHTFSEHQIPFLFVNSHAAQEVADILIKRQTTLLVNAVTPRILKRSTLQAVNRGVINVHPGLLPDFRGCTCVEWAVYLDERVGNTAHFMTEGIDDGPIIISEPLTFTPNDDYPAVRVRVYRAAFELMARAVRKVLDDDLFSSAMSGSPDEGRYFSVIGDEELKEVKAKLTSGRYLFQN
jgi:folate-dependent phosphoribosylglycinamide formyltransferase PurN